MSRHRNVTRIAALVVAVFTIVLAMACIVSPDRMMALRRSYFTPGGLYVGGAVRIAMGLVVILAAFAISAVLASWVDHARSAAFSRFWHGARQQLRDSLKRARL